MSFWRAMRREVDGALRSLRYDLLRRGAEPDHPPRRGIALVGLSLLVLAVAAGSYFTVLGVAGAVEHKKSTTAVTEPIIDHTPPEEPVSAVIPAPTTSTPTPTPSPSATRTPSLRSTPARTITPSMSPTTSPKDTTPPSDPPQEPTAPTTAPSEPTEHELTTR